MSASISSRSTKAQLLAHIAMLEAKLADRSIEESRIAASVAMAQAAFTAPVAEPVPAPSVIDDCERAIAGRFAPIDAIVTTSASRPARTFMSGGVLCHRVCIGFNRFAIRAVATA